MKRWFPIMILPAIIIVLTSAVFPKITLFKESPKFTYYGEVVTPSMIYAEQVKDPEFFRLPDHSLFRDDNGYYYVIVTANLFSAILRTYDFKKYEFVTTIGLVGKVAPYVIYNPQDCKFYMFYSDWLNTIQGDINYARLGLAIGDYSAEIASIRFEDQGYLNIEGSPLPDPNAGWDPYIVKIGETYFMIFSSAVHGVHLAAAQKLGTKWKYIGTIIHDRRENPTLFQYNDTWYMLIGIYDGEGYDLYSSSNFLEWNLIRRNWFIDPSYPVLPAGSTCVLIGKTLYHLYQVPLSENYISGPFSLKLAYAVIDEDEI